MKGTTLEISLWLAENGFQIDIDGGERAMVSETEDKARAILREEFEAFLTKAFDPELRKEDT